jgi:hypothetical protein
MVRTAAGIQTAGWRTTEASLAVIGIIAVVLTVQRLRCQGEMEGGRRGIKHEGYREAEK